MQRLNAEVVAPLAAPPLRDRLVSIGFDVLGSSPEDFAPFIKADMTRAGKVIQAAGIKLTDQ